jgi:ParB family chromosome partitioning protein
LKLAGVSPRLMKRYRDEALTLEQLMAFTVADDHKAQEAAWFDAPIIIVPEFQARALQIGA